MIRSRMTLAVAAIAVTSGAFAKPLPDLGNRFPPIGSIKVAPISCARLKGSVTLERNAKIVSSELNSTGHFGIFGRLPPFCRVVGQATSTRNSIINFEVWVPLHNNGKYQQVGNGGFAGMVNYFGLAEGVRRGYATASTDDGSQTPPSAAFALNQPDKIVDFAERAIKQTTDNAKDIVQALNGAKPTRSYFHGCSEGGREALIEAQRYPDDFDGIIVGAPANYWTHQFVSFAWNAKAAFTNAGQQLLAEDLMPALSAAVHQQCGGKDGGLPGDPFLTDPRKCKVDLQKVGLTHAQADIVQRIYDGPKFQNGKPIFPGLQPGNENHVCNWRQWITGQTHLPVCPPLTAPSARSFQALFSMQFFENFMAGANVHVQNFDFDHDTQKSDVALAKLMNATDANLEPFRSHGGKIIQYHGWADAAVAPENSINYLGQVKKKLGSTDDFYRLFMVPGMSHCAGGVGPNAFGSVFNGTQVDAGHDLLKALEQWVEQGVAPERIVAAKYSLDVPHDVDPKSQFQYERPLCPYPQIAHFVGSNPNQSNQASDFKCINP